MMKAQTRPRARIQYDEPPGVPPSVDDLYQPCTGVHLERIDTGQYWLGIYRGKQHMGLFIGTLSGKGNIHAIITENEL